METTQPVTPLLKTTIAILYLISWILIKYVMLWHDSWMNISKVVLLGKCSRLLGGRSLDKQNVNVEERNSMMRYSTTNHLFIYLPGERCKFSFTWIDFTIFPFIILFTNQNVNYSFYKTKNYHLIRVHLTNFSFIFLSAGIYFTNTCTRNNLKRNNKKMKRSK